MRPPRLFLPDFKARVAPDALVGDTTIQKIAATYKVHRNQAHTPKPQAIEGLDGVFSGGKYRCHART